MTRRPILAAAVLLPVAAAATPPQDLYNAFQQFDRHHWLQARDLARAYLAANGRNYSAELIVAGSECRLHPHLASNAAPFRKLLADYALPARNSDAVRGWIRDCTSPPPPPPSAEAGVSVSGLSVGPNTEAARPDANPPPLRRP